jgi:hypothetical protein
MNPMERVWKRMKVKAAKFARHGTPVSLRESQDAVLELCRQEKVQVPPREAVQFLAEELLRLTVEARSPV